ncbi:basic proline-rich protein-like [Candoia aspera]|uniref:basic proline-rich protein-like n=1 Tax=Candoia aspera TaxID=51853 RepID=UPI002FD873B2
MRAALPRHPLPGGGSPAAPLRGAEGPTSRAGVDAPPPARPGLPCPALLCREGPLWRALGPPQGDPRAGAAAGGPGDAVAATPPSPPPSGAEAPSPEEPARRSVPDTAPAGAALLGKGRDGTRCRSAAPAGRRGPGPRLEAEEVRAGEPRRRPPFVRREAAAAAAAAPPPPPGTGPDRTGPDGTGRAGGRGAPGGCHPASPPPCTRLPGAPGPAGLPGRAARHAGVARPVPARPRRSPELPAPAAWPRSPSGPARRAFGAGPGCGSDAGRRRARGPARWSSVTQPRWPPPPPAPPARPGVSSGVADPSCGGGVLVVVAGPRGEVRERKRGGGAQHDVGAREDASGPAWLPPGGLPGQAPPPLARLHGFPFPRRISPREGPGAALASRGRRARLQDLLAPRVRSPLPRFGAEAETPPPPGGCLDPGKGRFPKYCPTRFLFPESTRETGPAERKSFGRLPKIQPAGARLASGRHFPPPATGQGFPEKAWWAGPGASPPGKPPWLGRICSGQEMV